MGPPRIRSKARATGNGGNDAGTIFYQVVAFMFLAAMTMHCNASVDYAPLSDCTPSSPILPEDVDCAPVALSDETVIGWMSFVWCSPNGLDESFEEDLEVHRGDEAIVDSLFGVVDQGWQFDGVSASCTDSLSASLALSFIRALRDPTALPRLQALVWRPLPAQSVELDLLEQQAAAAISCIGTTDAASEAAKIVDMHPSVNVRRAAADQLSNPHCAFFE